MIRHSVSKLSHIHFVTNKAAKRVLINSGESDKSIFITGSPDIDLFDKALRPKLNAVKIRYGINFDNYIISFLHPVTTDSRLETKIKSKIYFEFLLKISNKNIIHFVPNNDDNSIEILKMQNKILNKKKI